MISVTVTAGINSKFSHALNDHIDGQRTSQLLSRHAAPDVAPETNARSVDARVDAQHASERTLWNDNQRCHTWAKPLS
jgi:hypothetical protein